MEVLQESLPATVGMRDLGEKTGDVAAITRR